MAIEYKYRIKNTGYGQERYGNCERCGKPCPFCYKQQRQKLDSTSNNWENFGYGHVDCLRNGNWANAKVID